MPVEKRVVAVSFLFKFEKNVDPKGKPLVALFRRSGEVRTYPHKYAPISGSVEPSDSSPLATAWREIKEETGLDGKAVQDERGDTLSNPLRLFREGKSYSFIDNEVNREWTIHPFSFIFEPINQGNGGEGITLNWEHKGYKWFDPNSVTDDASFQGVPRLKESLRRVWFELDLGTVAADFLSEGLRKLRDDHESGARRLAWEAVCIFVDVMRNLDTSDRDAWWENVRFVGWHLWKNGRESMGAAILNRVLDCLEIIAHHIPDTDSPLSESFLLEIETKIKCYQERESEQTPSKEINIAFDSFLREQPSQDPFAILTLSSSSTVESSMIHVLKGSWQEQRPHRFDIRILESRPLYEGSDLASRLSRKVGCNSKVTVYTDASAAIASKDVDIVLLGADIIDKAGNVSNKTGSLPAVLAARHVSPHVRVMVLAEREKISGVEPPGVEENDSWEVIAPWARNWHKDSRLEARNIYFEWVGAELIDYYITEDGINDVEYVKKSAEHAADRAKIFDDI